MTYQEPFLFINLKGKFDCLIVTYSVEMHKEVILISLLSLTLATAKSVGRNWKIVSAKLKSYAFYE